MHDAPPERRPVLALIGYGYWHFGLLLGVIAVAAGLKKAVGTPTAELDTWIACELAVGVALFVACDVGFRRALGIPRGGARLVVAVVALATIPLGTELDGKTQIAALAALVVCVLLVEGRRGRANEPGPSLPAA